MDAANAEQYVKVFVRNVPRGLSEDEISPVFKVFGNIVEIHILRDKHTGQAKGSVFVKYATMEEARNCIATLDGTAAFPDYSDKIVEVRLANGEESRLDHRLYVGKLPITTTSDEIRDAFSEFGSIAEISVKRRSGNSTSGPGGSSGGDGGTVRPFAFAFVKFVEHSAAEAAVQALNGKQFISGAPGSIRVAYAESQPAATHGHSHAHGHSHGHSHGYGHSHMHGHSQTHTQPHSHAHGHTHGRQQAHATKAAVAAPAPAPSVLSAPLPFTVHPSFPPVHSAPASGVPPMYMQPPPAMHYGYYPPPPPPASHGHFMPPMMMGPMGGVAALPPATQMHTGHPQHPHPSPHHHHHPQFMSTSISREPRLHVGSLPNTVTREQLVEIFSMYGHVIECHVMRPKGGSSSSCSAFVRFATQEQADVTVNAVNGCLFPGTTRCMVVKYANSESLFPENSISADQPGSKLFVGGVPPAATEDDIRSVFALFGTVTDVFLMRHSDGTSKGSAFVKYATREMAERALMSVDGLVTMQGGRRALHVRFAGRSSSSSGGRSIPPSPAADASPQHSPALYTPSPSPSPMPSIPTPPGSPLGSPVSMTASTATALIDDPQRGQKHSIEREGDEPELPTKLFVGGIPYSMTEPELARFFSMYGVPRDVFILKNENMQSKGCAFVRMSTQAESERAIRAIDRVVTLPGASKPLRVQFAENDDFSAKRQRR